MKFLEALFSKILMGVPEFQCYLELPKLVGTGSSEGDRDPYAEKLGFLLTEPPRQQAPTLILELSN